MLFHPGVAKVACCDCKRWIYEPETGKRKTYKAGADRRELPYVRPPNVPTPCHECPKGSPEREHEFRLSARNWRTLQAFLEARSCGVPAGWLRDPLFRRNASILGELFRRFDRQRQADELAARLVEILNAMRR